MVFLVSCDEIDKIFNPSSDEYLVDKTISPGTTEQIIESGDDIKIIFPANSLSGNLGLKIKKESSVPAFNVANTKLGNNVHKIIFTGNTAFSSPVKIIINYDKSKIPAGKTAVETIKGYVYANGNWKFGDFVLDEANSKIIFSVSNLAMPKTGKNGDVILENEGEVNFGDGYSTTDTGQNDAFIALMHKCFNISIDFSGYHSGLNNGEWSSIHVPIDFGTGSDVFIDSLKWDGNNFSVNQSGYGYTTTIAGTVNSGSKTISLTAISDQVKEWEDSVIVSCELRLENVPYWFDSMGYKHNFMKDGGGPDVQKLVKGVYYQKTIKKPNGDVVETYQSTDFSRNASVEIEMMHR